jgi:hypothetical protein
MSCEEVRIKKDTPLALPHIVVLEVIFTFCVIAESNDRGGTTRLHYGRRFEVNIEDPTSEHGLGRDLQSC